MQFKISSIHFVVFYPVVCVKPDVSYEIRGHFNLSHVYGLHKKYLAGFLHILYGDHLKCTRVFGCISNGRLFTGCVTVSGDYTAG
jgi:hypothetical protein